MCWKQEKCVSDLNNWATVMVIQLGQCLAAGLVGHLQYTLFGIYQKWSKKEQQANIWLGMDDAVDCASLVNEGPPGPICQKSNLTCWKVNGGYKKKVVKLL